MCIVTGKKGQFVWTEGNDEEALSRGVYNTYTSHNLRYSQVSVIVLFTCSGNSCCWMITNLPVQEQINSLLNFTAPHLALPIMLTSLALVLLNKQLEMSYLVAARCIDSAGYVSAHVNVYHFHHLIQTKSVALLAAFISHRQPGNTRLSFVMQSVEQAKCIFMYLYSTCYWAKLGLSSE